MSKLKTLIVALAYKIPEWVPPPLWRRVRAGYQPAISPALQAQVYWQPLERRSCSIWFTLEGFPA